MGYQQGRQRRRISRREQPVPERAGVWFERRNEFADTGEQLRMQVHQRFGDFLVQPR
jgi:hypothetical protein